MAPGDLLEHCDSDVDVGVAVWTEFRYGVPVASAADPKPLSHFGEVALVVLVVLSLDLLCLLYFDE